MCKVLVTGAAGFIGNKVGALFKKNGYDVIGWDRVTKNGEYLTVDICMNDVNSVCKALDDFKPDIIVHCAGSADVSFSIENPEIDFQGNVVLTHTILFALHKLGMECTRFIFLSSAGVYGNPKSIPINEEMELNPLSPYALHKVMCEELCKYFVKNYNMDIKVARIFSAYGAGLKKQIFWDMYKKSKSGSLVMFGTGNESRDYIHVDDVVNSIYILATTDSKELFFNIANGEEVTIREATETFARNIGLNSNNIVFNGIVREGDPLNWKADISRIKKIGYKKTMCLDEGLLEYIKWAGTVNDF